MRDRRTTATLAALFAVVVLGVGLVAPAPTATSAAGANGVVSADDWFVKLATTIGQSRRDRPIRAWYRGDREAAHVLVLLGQMHGDEGAGRRTARWVRDNVRPRRGPASGSSPR